MNPVFSVHTCNKWLWSPRYLALLWGFSEETFTGGAAQRVLHQWYGTYLPDASEGLSTK